MTLTVGSLFSGIGGFDIAAESLGWRTSWFVEWDAACRFWLAEHFPNRPIYGDITEVDFTAVEPVDVLCGGFPCPPVSAAGKRLGKRDPRWLWPHFERAVRDLRPRYVAIENVPGLLSTRDDEFGQPLMGTVLGDLAALGYDAEWQVLSAADVGSPQGRERVWIVAYPDSGRREQPDAQFGRDEKSGAGCVQMGHTASARRAPRPRASSGEIRDSARRPESERRCSSVGDTRSAGQQERVATTVAGRERHLAGERGGLGNTIGIASDEYEPIAVGRSRYTSEPWADGVPVRGLDGTVRVIPRDAAERGPESPLFPVAARLPGVVARHRAIGNAVVPKCVVEGPFAVIVAREAARMAA